MVKLFRLHDQLGSYFPAFSAKNSNRNASIWPIDNTVELRGRWIPRRRRPRFQFLFARVVGDRRMNE